MFADEENDNQESGGELDQAINTPSDFPDESRGASMDSAGGPSDETGGGQAGDQDEDDSEEEEEFADDDEEKSSDNESAT